MQIVTKELVDELTEKYGESFKIFLNHKVGDLEREYLGWRHINWIKDQFAEIDQHDDVTTKISVSKRTYADFFRTFPSDVFSPTTQAELIRAGLYGSLWSANVIIDDTLSPGMFRFESANGRSKEVIKFG